MPRRVEQLVRNLLAAPNLRPAVVLLTSAVCLTTWHLMGRYQFWFDLLTAANSTDRGPNVMAGILSLITSVLLLGIFPLLVVKFLLRERLAGYGVRLGDWRFAVICSLLATPLLVAIGYSTAQSSTFQAVYPINPAARLSGFALALHLVGQLFWYAAWEFHFRGFLQHGLSRRAGIATAICVQTLASTLAHFDRPGPEVYAAILGGLLWGALAWRTRSLLAGYFQHWLLGASLDFFICRGS
jgi:membrane protease YdiL (CAAX protease family)